MAGTKINLYGDNGTNFKGANSISNLKGEQAMKEYNVSFRDELLKLDFNPSQNPWMGGIWERGVGSIKYHLNGTTKNWILSKRSSFKL